MKLKRLTDVLFSFVIACFLMSCSSGEESLWLKSPDWSRGVFVGNTASVSPASFVNDDDGNVTFFLSTLNSETSEYSFDLAQLDSGTGPPSHEIYTHYQLRSLKQPQIIIDDNGETRLFWIAEEGLYTMHAGDDGNLVEEPVLLSGSYAVAYYDIAQTLEGHVAIWFAGSRRSPGIYALDRYDGTGQPVLVDAQGTLVRIRYDVDGHLHAAWVYYPFGFERSEFRYGIYDGNDFSAITPAALPFDIGPSVSLDDFSLGVDDSYVYLMWTTNVHSGPSAGDIQGQYHSFPRGSMPQALSKTSILAPTIYSLEFDDPSPLDVHTGKRVSYDNLNAPVTSKVQDFRTNVVPSSEVALVFRSPAEHLWRKTREQVNILYFDDGSLSAYQPLTFTSTVSTFPNVITNSDDFLSMTWLERDSSGGYSVYYASTDPEVVSNHGDLSGSEILNLIYTVLFGMLIGALLAPIAAAVWTLAPLVILALFSFVQRLVPEKWDRRVSVIGIGFAILSIWFVKLAVFPMMLDYVPFSAWIPNIPAWLAVALRIAVPLLTLLIAGWTAWHYTYRRENHSSLYFLLIYVAIDALITTSIYAVLIYGTFVQ